MQPQNYCPEQSELCQVISTGAAHFNEICYQAWWCTPLTSAPGRQEDLWEAHSQPRLYTENLSQERKKKRKGKGRKETRGDLLLKMHCVPKFVVRYR